MFSFLPKRWRLLGGLFLAAALIVVALPYALDAYHLQAGGQALERALGRHEPLEWWYVGPREIRDSSMLDAAIAHLEKAGRAPYALRLLGQAYVARGDVLQGVRALEQFVEQRPNHHLSQLELAAAYVYADQRLPELEYLDLLDHLNTASISAPDLDEQAHYSAEEWQSAYVYPTTYSLPPEYGDRPTLFIHAGSQVAWTITLTEPSVLRFGMGQDPESLGWGGDGATFEVFADGERVFLEHLPVEKAREGWHEREVDLGSYAGRTIQLSLVTTPGQVGDMTGDWAGWGEPRIEDAQAVAYHQTVKTQPWRAKWSQLGIQAGDWLEAARAALEHRQYGEALQWTTWLAPVDGSQGLAYRELALGLLYLQDGAWSEAFAAFERASEAPQPEGFPLGSLHYQMGRIQLDHLGQSESALDHYERALASGEFLSNSDRADTYYRAGALHRHKGEHVRAREELLQAIELVPYHYGALIELGRIYWQIDGNYDLAEITLRRAVNASASAKWAYRALGDLYVEQNRFADAQEAYRRVLEIDPADQHAQTQLDALITP